MSSILRPKSLTTTQVLVYLFAKQSLVSCRVLRAHWQKSELSGLAGLVPSETEAGVWPPNSFQGVYAEADKADGSLHGRFLVASVSGAAGTYYNRVLHPSTSTYFRGGMVYVSAPGFEADWFIFSCDGQTLASVWSTRSGNAAFAASIDDTISAYGISISKWTIKP